MTEITKYEHGRFCWVDFSAKDMAAAEKWYAELFGWGVTREDTKGGPPYAMFTKNGKVVAGLGQLNDEMKAAGVPALWNNYVAVNDAAKIEAHVKQLGGKVVVPPMKVMDAGTLAFFTDTGGATFAVWQADRHQGALLANEPGSFAWNELATHDLGKSAGFYAELFGWQFVDVPGSHPYKVGKNDGKDGCGLMQIDKTMGDMPSAWMTYFAVENTDKTVEAVKASGGTVIAEPQDIPQGRFAVVSDPQGGVFNVIALPSK